MKNDIKEVKMSPKYIIRSKTNGGEYCKQIFRIIKINDGSDISLHIHKLVLAKDTFEIYEKYRFENIKQYKGKILYKQVFTIKLKTLDELLKWISNFK